jgi:hypothetical protein
MVEDRRDYRFFIYRVISNENNSRRQVTVCLKSSGKLSAKITVCIQCSLLVYIVIACCFVVVFQSHHKDDEPMYCCHICDNLFQRGSLLTQHLMVQHSIFWPPGHSRFRSV